MLNTYSQEQSQYLRSLDYTFQRGDRDLAKYPFDMVLALLLLPAVLPAIVLLYVLIRLDGGPGLFGHVRIGQNGVPFRCWKLRTMVPDAAEVLRRHLAYDSEAAAEWARDFKLRNDPRITRIGKFLRRTSLDELPQIWNVLRGEMSFVGPRPVTEPELDRYGADLPYYLSVKPGITGLWQVSGRNDVDYRTRVSLDKTYCQTRTFLGDLVIVLQTATVFFSRTGH